jgi:hypothetical protein
VRFVTPTILCADSKPCFRNEQVRHRDGGDESPRRSIKPIARNFA